MFIPYSNNYNSDSYKTYKNNSEKLAKNNDQSISSIANDESDFYRFVLNAFN